jgi:oxaloacetate decarboxylase gamma subunit
MEENLFDQGLTLMLAGMGTVFTFLTVLVIAMTLMSRLLMPGNRASGDTNDADVTDEEIAAISAAISRHRSSNKI